MNFKKPDFYITLLFSFLVSIVSIFLYQHYSGNNPWIEEKLFLTTNSFSKEKLIINKKIKENSLKIEKIETSVEQTGIKDIEDSNLEKISNITINDIFYSNKIKLVLDDNTYCPLSNYGFLWYNTYKRNKKNEEIYINSDVCINYWDFNLSKEILTNKQNKEEILSILREINSIKENGLYKNKEWFFIDKKDEYITVILSEQSNINKYFNEIINNFRNDIVKIIFWEKNDFSEIRKELKKRGIDSNLHLKDNNYNFSKRTNVFLNVKISSIDLVQEDGKDFYKVIFDHWQKMPFSLPVKQSFFIDQDENIDFEIFKNKLGNKENNINFLKVIKLDSLKTVNKHFMMYILEINKNK